MESFGHKMFISSQPVPLTGTGVLYPRLRDFQHWPCKDVAVSLTIFVKKQKFLKHPSFAFLPHLSDEKIASEVE